MIYKEHTRNQKRMYRIHKQEEKIQEQELIIASLQQRIDKIRKHCKKEYFIDESGKPVIDKADKLLKILGGDKENE